MTVDDPVSAVQARQRILVVDDEPELREIVQLVLEEDGYEVLTASDGQEGLESVLSLQPDLVLLDMSLPVMSGEEFAAGLRAAVTHPVPIIVMSAAGTIVERAARIGAVGSVSKPFDLDDLSAAVRKALPPR
ncbi:MAG: response regulator [Chloroflexota bacterium]